jgi:hypothetical protein
MLLELKDHKTSYRLSIALPYRAVTELNTLQAYQHLCSHITHTSLPCPARKLELVIYTLSTIQNLTRFPQFSLNFNTGANMGDHVTLDPTQEAGHWFLLDLAVGRELGVALLGPDPKGLIGEVKREWVIDALRESVNWWERNEGTSADAVLNACRGWRWVRCGVWESKVEGAKWVVENEPGVRGVVESAIEARGSKMELGGKKVLQLLKVVKEEMSSV